MTSNIQHKHMTTINEATILLYLSLRYYKGSSRIRPSMMYSVSSYFTITRIVWFQLGENEDKMTTTIQATNADTHTHIHVTLHTW